VRHSTEEAAGGAAGQPIGNHSPRSLADGSRPERWVAQLPCLRTQTARSNERQLPFPSLRVLRPLARDGLRERGILLSGQNKSVSLLKASSSPTLGAIGSQVVVTGMTMPPSPSMVRQVSAAATTQRLRSSLSSNATRTAVHTRAVHRLMDSAPAGKRALAHL